MKSVVDETGSKTKSKKKKASDKKADEEREALLALSADEGVTRAQVTATMQSLLIAVQDKVMTESKCVATARAAKRQLDCRQCCGSETKEAATSSN